MYANPIQQTFLADPFILKHQGQYYAYGTGSTGPNGERFPVMYSDDCDDWKMLGWSLLPEDGDDFWAPEVAYNDGLFYMYYSAHGMDGRRGHQLRVAISDSPLGPFYDAETSLVPGEPFTTDPHPFRAADGQWYIFYAQNFFTEDRGYRAGMGIVVDRMLDMTTLAGTPEIVIRPFADWHLFQAKQRTADGCVDWHAVGGPAVRYHNGRYYCFYYGGGSENTTYGMGYVISDHPMGDYRLPPSGQAPLLPSNPGIVIAPGQNSFTTSVDDSQELIIYHAWDMVTSAPIMRVDRLEWEGNYPVIA
jgi:beta-xylosidase